jgi:hypothetical protein
MDGVVADWLSGARIFRQLMIEMNPGNKQLFQNWADMLQEVFVKDMYEAYLKAFDCVYRVGLEEKLRRVKGKQLKPGTPDTPGNG